MFYVGRGRSNNYNQRQQIDIFINSLISLSLWLTVTVERTVLIISFLFNQWLEVTHF